MDGLGDVNRANLFLFDNPNAACTAFPDKQTHLFELRNISFDSRTVNI